MAKTLAVMLLTFVILLIITITPVFIVVFLGIPHSLSLPIYMLNGFFIGFFVMPKVVRYLNARL